MGNTTISINVEEKNEASAAYTAEFDVQIEMENVKPQQKEKVITTAAEIALKLIEAINHQD